MPVFNIKFSSYYNPNTWIQEKLRFCVQFYSPIHSDSEVKHFFISPKAKLSSEINRLVKFILLNAKADIGELYVLDGVIWYGNHYNI